MRLFSVIFKHRVSGNTVWLQAAGFQDHFWHFSLTFVHSYCKRSSLRLQCWMRLFLWFSNTVPNFCILDEPHHSLIEAISTWCFLHHFSFIASWGSGNCNVLGMEQWLSSNETSPTKWSSFHLRFLDRNHYALENSSLLLHSSLYASLESKSEVLIHYSKSADCTLFENHSKCRIGIFQELLSY